MVGVRVRVLIILGDVLELLLAYFAIESPEDAGNLRLHSLATGDRVLGHEQSQSTPTRNDADPAHLTILSLFFGLFCLSFGI